MRIMAGGGRVDAATLASFEILKMIKEMRADDQRRRAQEM